MREKCNADKFREIRTLLGDNRIEKAFIALEKHLPTGCSSGLSNQVIVLESQNNDIRQQYRLRQISFAEYLRQRAQIVMSLLEVVDLLENHELCS